MKQIDKIDIQKQVLELTQLISYAERDKDRVKMLKLIQKRIVLKALL